MQNTANEIEALATAQAVTLTQGNDLNMIEQIAAAEAVTLTTAGNDENVLEELTTAIGEA